MGGLVGYVLDDKTFRLFLLSFKIIPDSEQILTLILINDINRQTASHDSCWYEVQTLPALPVHVNSFQIF